MKDSRIHKGTDVRSGSYCMILGETHFEHFSIVAHVSLGGLQAVSGRRVVKW